MEPRVERLRSIATVRSPHRSSTRASIDWQRAFAFNTRCVPFSETTPAFLRQAVLLNLDTRSRKPFHASRPSIAARGSVGWGCANVSNLARRRGRRDDAEITVLSSASGAAVRIQHYGSQFAAPRVRYGTRPIERFELGWAFAPAVLDLAGRNSAKAILQEA
jgi:hypothetical protein